MSEAELCLIRQRMLSGRLAKAERGELAVPDLSRSNLEGRKRRFLAYSFLPPAGVRVRESP